MRKVLIFLGLLLLVALVMSHWPKGEGEQVVRPTKSRSALSERDGVAEQGAPEGGFANSESRLNDLVEELEEEGGQWLREFGLFHFYKIEEYEWRKFSRERIARLSTVEMAGLLARIDENELSYLTSVGNYREALFWNWGRQDASAALRYLEDYWDDDEVLMPSKLSRSSYTDLGSTWVFEGWATRDAKGAWEFYNKARESSDEQWLEGWNTTEAIFREMTAQNAKAAWELTESESRPDVRRNMVFGYLAGLAENQDWAEVASRVAAVAEGDSFRAELAKRWFLADSDAALDWYQDGLSVAGRWADPFSEMNAEMSNQEIAAHLGVTEQELWTDAKYNILLDIGTSQGRRGIEILTSWAEKRLSNEGAAGAYLLDALIFLPDSDGPSGDVPFSNERARALQSESLERTLVAEGIDFLPLIASLSPEVARMQMISVLNALPEIRGNLEPAGRLDWTFESSKMARDVVRTLVEKVPLFPEEKTQVETVFGQLDEQERILLEGWKREAEGSE